MPVCDGEEKHSHYQTATGMLVYHRHLHPKIDKEFNRLHHHAPTIHEGLSQDVLEQDYEELDVPF